MPGVIVKSGYIKNSNHIKNLIEYISNKVEAQNSDGISPNDRKLIEDLNDNPELVLTEGEKIEDLLVRIGYAESREHAENYVNMMKKALDDKELHEEDGTIKTVNPKKYLKYIATRPGVEKIEGLGHGLFTLDGSNDEQREIERLSEHEKSIKWSQIISLSRDDAERTGYDNRKAWETLIRARADSIAKTYNISLKNLVVNAAFHDKDYHPHVHLIFYSTDKREGYVPDMKKASEKIKSLMFNEIFKEDVELLKKEKTNIRDELSISIEKSLKRLYSKDYNPPAQLSKLLIDLSDSIAGTKGKNVYGFLKPEVKAKVSNILQYMITSDKELNKLYSEYLNVQGQFIKKYIDNPEKINARLKEFSETFFNPGKNDTKTLHNIIVKYAGRISKDTFDLGESPEGHDAADDEPKKIKGYNVPAGGKDKASKGVEELAAQGNVIAQCRLDRMHLSRESEKYNSSKAVYWLKRAAENGNSKAQFALWKLLIGDESGDRSKEAFSWLKRSAADGNQYAEFAIGMEYLKGGHVDKSLTFAKKYFKSASKKGNVPAENMLKYINGSREKTAAYAALLLIRETAYIIGRDTRRDDFYLNFNKMPHSVSQKASRFTIHKFGRRRNISGEISY